MKTKILLLLERSVFGWMNSIILAAAKKFLHPDKLVFLVVGDVEAVKKGSDKHEEKYSDFGKIEILPLRDPVTLETR